MLLTKDQQKHITKILSRVAKGIRREQEKDYSNKAQDPQDRFQQLGRQAAYEKCYHIAKTAAEESYAAEYDGADVKIEDICKQLEAQALYFENIDCNRPPTEIEDKLEDQAALTRTFVRNIRLLLHLSEDS